MRKKIMSNVKMTRMRLMMIFFRTFGPDRSRSRMQSEERF